MRTKIFNILNPDNNSNEIIELKYNPRNTEAHITHKYGDDNSDYYEIDSISSCDINGCFCIWF